MTKILTKKYDFSPVKTVEGWAGLISTSWHRATEQILETAQLILEAEKRLSPSSIRQLKMQSLPFGVGTYSKLKKIAESNVITNPKNLEFLPNSFSTIYELTHLSENEFNQAVNDGTLTTDTTRLSVIELRSKSPSKSSGLPTPKTKKKTFLVSIKADSSLTKTNAMKVQKLLDGISKIDGISEIEASPEFNYLLK